jgi:parallel beta-helix repeat protein
MRKLAVLAVLALVAGLMALGGGQAMAKGGCSVTVSAGDGSTAIQDAVDAASAGDKICLSGTFTTTSGPGGTSEVSTVTIGTSGITLKSASAAVLDGGDGPAFRLADGVSNVTIEGLEIENRTGFRGGGIEAWDCSTSNITVRNNYMHDNSYNAVLVGSEGGYVHKNWSVTDNTVDDQGFAGIELTNCETCKIMKNSVGPTGYAGILVQARNTSTTGSTTTNVHINSVEVLHNTVDDAGAYGIYVLSFKGHPTNFTPITGGSTLLTNVTINNNKVTDSGSGGVIFWAYNGGAAANNATINHNDITCASSGPPSGRGVRVLEAGAAGGGTVTNVKVVNNSYGNCATDVEDTGTGTKIKP